MVLILPVVVLKNCEHEISYMLADVFNICLKESYFLHCWKVSSAILALENINEKSVALNCCSANLLCVFGKICQKIGKNRLVDHHQKYGLFFLIFSMVSGLQVQLYIFRNL